MATSYKAVQTVEVRIWGQTVGAIALEPGKGYYAFEYDPKFRSKNIELAPLQMPLYQGRDLKRESIFSPSISEATGSGNLPTGNYALCFTCFGNL